MATTTKIINGNLKDIKRKIEQCVPAFCPNTITAGEDSTELNGVHSHLIVFEKEAPLVWRNNAWVGQPHYSLSVNLVASKDQVHLCAISSGGSDSALMDALKLTLGIFDDII